MALAMRETDHIPAGGAQLVGAQAGAVGEQDHSGMAVGVAGAWPLRCSRDELLNLLAGEVLARPKLGAGEALRPTFPLTMVGAGGRAGELALRGIAARWRTFPFPTKIGKV